LNLSVLLLTVKFAIAGIWDTWKSAERKVISTFSIITTKANSAIASIHNRMPVILKPDDEQLWLMENDQRLLTKLLAPYDSQCMSAYSISKKVNSPINNNREIIIPHDDDNLMLFYPEE